MSGHWANSRPNSIFLMSTRSMELPDNEIGTEIEIDTNIETTANI